MNPYDFAIQMSHDGEKFFRTLTKQVKKPSLRKILVTLAKDQAIHRRDFAKMKKAEGRSLPDVGNLAGAVNPFAERLKRLGRGERVDENLPPAELYRRGQALDKACEDFYRKRAARIKNPELKQAYLDKETRAHAGQQSITKQRDERFHKMTGMTFQDKNFENMIHYYKAELDVIYKSKDERNAITSLSNDIRKTLKRNDILTGYRGKIQLTEKARKYLRLNN